jgi:AP-3 complex subunit delta-1
MVFEKTLTALIKGLRASVGRENEYIQECITEIRRELAGTGQVSSVKGHAILKLAYLQMMGYDMTWAHFNVVEVMSDSKFWMKRSAQLAAMTSFSENTDVVLLTINLLKKDFSSHREVETGMALSCVATIATPDMARDLYPDVVTMLSSSRPYIRKKAVLCLFRLFVRNPKAVIDGFPKLKERLKDEDQGVLNATVNTMLELGRKNTQILNKSEEQWLVIPTLFQILNKTTDNWLVIKLLKVFQLLCPQEEKLVAKMVEPVNQILSTTKAKSVEYEAVRLVVRCLAGANPVLASTAAEKLRDFCNSSDRNLRYLGLTLFEEALKTPMREMCLKDMSGRIAESVEEADVTIRRMSLQILHQVISPDTFPEITKKLMDMKVHGTSEFAQTILAMGCRDQFAMVEDFGWYLIILTEIGREH